MKEGGIGLEIPMIDVNTFTFPSSHFLSVLRRSESDGVGMEDLDTLQMELEAMLAAVVVKKNTLKEEVKVVQNIEKFKGSGKNQGKRVRDKVFTCNMTAVSLYAPLFIRDRDLLVKDRPQHRPRPERGSSLPGSPRPRPTRPSLVSPRSNPRRLPPPRPSRTLIPFRMNRSDRHLRPRSRPYQRTRLQTGSGPLWNHIVHR